MRHLTKALNILRIEVNPFLTKYFSDANVNYLQNEVVRTVKTQTGITISRQSDDELLNIMIFMFQNYRMIVLGQPLNTGIKDLNAHVFNTVTPMVMGNAVSQAKYIDYISKPRELMPLGVSTTSRGKDVLEYRPGIQ